MLPGDVLHQLSEMGIPPEVADASAAKLTSMDVDIEGANNEVLIPLIIDHLEDKSFEYFSHLQLPCLPNASEQQFTSTRSCECPICLMALQDVDAYKVAGCSHIFHRNCFKEHVRVKIYDGAINDIKCPSCPTVVEQLDLERLVSLRTVDMYRQLKRDNSIARDSHRRHCPSPNCAGVLQLPPHEKRAVYLGMSVLVSLLVIAAVVYASCISILFGYDARLLAFTSTVGVLLALGLMRNFRDPETKKLREWGWPVTCPVCENSYCFACGQLSHTGHPCVSDGLVEMWAESRDAQHCPRCHAMIERNQGCNHMTCHCGYEFCWLCGEEYSDGHFNSGHPQYGGNAETSVRSILNTILDGVFLLSMGTIASDVYLLRPIGPDVMLWKSLAYFLGPMCLYRLIQRDPCTGRLAALLLSLSFLAIFHIVLQVLSEKWIIGLATVKLEILAFFILRFWPESSPWTPVLFKALVALVVTNELLASVDKFAFHHAPWCASMLGACSIFLLGYFVSITVFKDPSSRTEVGKIIASVRAILLISVATSLQPALRACYSVGGWIVAVSFFALTVILLVVSVPVESGMVPIPDKRPPAHKLVLVILWLLRLVKEFSSVLVGSLPNPLVAFLVAFGALASFLASQRSTHRKSALFMGASVAALAAIAIRVFLQYHCFCIHLVAGISAGCFFRRIVVARRPTKVHRLVCSIAICVLIEMQVYSNRSDSTALFFQRMWAFSFVIPLVATRSLCNALRNSAVNRYTDALVAG